MREKRWAVLILSGLLGVLVSAPVWGGDEEDIREAIRIVRDRFNVRDWESLVGKIEEEGALVAPVEDSRKDSLMFSGGVGDIQGGSLGIPDKLDPAQEDTVRALERLGLSREEALRLVVVRRSQMSREDSLRFAEHSGMGRGDGVYTEEPAGGDTSWVGAQGEVGGTPMARPHRPYAFRPEKIYHDYITTAEEEYALEERKGMRGALREVFEEIPPEVGLFLEVRGIEISGEHATVRVAYYFKAMVDTERSRRYTALGKREMTLHLGKREERWKLKEVKGLVDEMKAVAKGE